MQIKCKEDRKPNNKKPTTKKSVPEASAVDDASSYLSTDDDEEHQNNQSQPSRQQEQPLQLPFFVVDDFDTQLQIDPADNSNVLDLFKEDDFLLAADWSNALSQNSFL